MSSKKPTFTSSALDKLVDESIAEADQFEEELKKIDASQIAIPDISETDDYVPEEDKAWGEMKSVVNRDTGETIQFSYVYKKIADLIDNGNAALQMLQSIDLEVAEPSLIGATASLMNSIRGCISEFTKIHQQWIKFNQAVKLEDKRLENKMKFAKFKSDLANGIDGEDVRARATDLYEIKSADLVAFLNWKKEQEELEKQKEEKI